MSLEANDAFAGPSGAPPVNRAAPDARDFQFLFEAAPSPYLVLHPDAPRFTIAGATDAYCQATLTVRELIVGRGLFEVFSDDNPANPKPTGVSNLRASLETVLRTKAPHRMPVQRYDPRRPDGSWEVRYWAPLNTPVLGPDGEVWYILHHVEDVTERIIQSQAANAAEHRTARILERMSDAVFTFDSEWRYTSYNPAGRAMLRDVGGDPDALPGQVIWEVFPELVGTPFERGLREAARDGQAVRVEISYPDTAGQTLVAEGDAVPMDEGVAVYLRDVSAYRRFLAAERDARSEAERARDRTTRLQALTAALAATYTPEDVAAVAVAECVAATGAVTGALVLRASDESKEAVIVRQAGLPEEVLARFGRFAITAPGPAAACLRTGEPSWLESRDAILARFPEIANLWEHLGTQALATVPLSVAGETVGALTFTFGAPRSFTDEDRDFYLASGRQCAQALERARLFAAEHIARADAEAARIAADRARREADEANQAKSAFLATMSHEIRTPINAIVGYAQLIELGVAGPVTTQQRDYLARLAATSEHLRGLVDDVLDLAKIDAGGMTIAREFGLTGPVVATALDLVRPQASAKGIRLIDERPGDPGEPYVGDDHRVRQILLNLLSNAVKFTEPGGAVTVTCGAADETPSETALRGDGPWTFIRVRDTGIGIPPEEQTRIFEPFHQVDQRHTRQHGGTGLGLAISRRLARLMGGDLGLESAPGAGSTFTLWLPAARAAVGGVESAIERGARARQEPDAVRAHGLAEVGMHLRERVEDIIGACAARLRADPAFPQAAHLRRSELEDHQLSFLADVAQTLVVIEETGGPESDLLRDGSTIQRIAAELHGAMRQRRGWTESQLAHEYAILGEELAAVVRRRVPEGAGDVSLALEVLARLIERARATGLAALRRAAESEDGQNG